MSEDWPIPKSAYGLTYNQKDYAENIKRLAGMYSSAVILATPNGDVFNSATGFLFKPAGRAFLVTNAHVVDFYRTELAKNSDLKFQFGDKVFEPTVVAHHSEDRVDLSVIDVDGMTFSVDPGYWRSSADVLEAYAPGRWPLDPPIDGSSTVIVGWPAMYRTRDGKEAEFGAFPLLGNVARSVQETSFVVQFEREHWIAGDHDATSPILVEKDFGGMSGSPVFAMHRRVHPLQLVGVVARYSELLDGFLCTRADLITAEGMVS